MKALKKELRSLKRKYGDERRTQISQQAIADQTSASKTARRANKADDADRAVKETKPKIAIQRSEQAKLTITNENHVYWTNPDNTEAVTDLQLQPGAEFTVWQQPIAQAEKVIFVADSGRAYPIAIADLPHQLESQNSPTYSFLSSAAQREARDTVAHFFMPPSEQAFELILLSQQGMLKRLSGAEIRAIGNRGFVLIKLKEKDRLAYLNLAQPGQELAIATNGGRILRFPIDDEQIPQMGRNAQGHQALRLRYGEKIVGCTTATPQDKILLLTKLGYGKQLDINAIRLAKRGDIGTQALGFNNKQDRLAAMMVAKSGLEGIVTTSENNRIPLSIDAVAELSRESKGNKVLKLNDNETVTKFYLPQELV